MIGQIESEPGATHFANFLYLKGIQHRVEPERDGTWSVWVYEEEEIDRSRQFLDHFLANPEAPQFQTATDVIRESRAREKEEAERAHKRFFGRGEIFRQGESPGMGRVTVVLVGISVLVAILSGLGRDRVFLEGLLLRLPLVFNGEIWRLVTPIFIHFGPVHLLFNMFWLYDLGSMIEGRQGGRKLLLMVAVMGVLSNLGQYFVSGPAFGGMSGVVFGLLGYIWIRGKLDPGSGLFLHPHIVALMIVFYLLGVTQVITVFFNINVANTAHTVGLVLGMAWGYMEALRANSRT